MSLKELGKFLMDEGWEFEAVRALNKPQRQVEVARILAEKNSDWE